jgi:RHS repeat-associated protein
MAIFEYDAFGTPIKKTGDGGSTVYVSGIYEVVNPGAPGAVHRYHVTNGTAVVATVSRAIVNNVQQQTTQYFHHDALGSVDVITNASGTSVEPQYFDAWGQRLQGSWGGPPQTTASPSSFGYTGHQHDQDFGQVNLVNMIGRHYDPKLGRFLSAVSVVAAPFSSQGLNRYSYVYNSPTNLTDPTGHVASEMTWMSGADFEHVERIGSEPTWGTGGTDAGPDSRTSPAQEGLAGLATPGVPDAGNVNSIPGAAKFGAEPSPVEWAGEPWYKRFGYGVADFTYTAVGGAIVYRLVWSEPFPGTKVAMQRRAGDYFRKKNWATSEAWMIRLGAAAEGAETAMAGSLLFKLVRYYLATRLAVKAPPSGDRILYHYTDEASAAAIRQSGGLKASEPGMYWSVNLQGVHDAGFVSPATGMGNRSNVQNIFFTDVAPSALTPELAAGMGLRSMNAVFSVSSRALRRAGIPVFQNPSNPRVFNAVTAWLKL